MLHQDFFVCIEFFKGPRGNEAGKGKKCSSGLKFLPEGTDSPCSMQGGPMMFIRSHLIQIVLLAFLAASVLSSCAEQVNTKSVTDGSDSNAFGGSGFFRRAVIFATSTTEEPDTRCWYGSVVGSYRSRDFALQEAERLNLFALPDRSLEEGAQQLQVEANLRQLSSAAFCIYAVTSSMGLAAPICILGVANSWQAWGELDAVDVSSGNLDGAAAKSMTDWPYDQVVGLQKVIRYASEKRTSGRSCPANPPNGAVKQVVAPRTAGQTQVCSLYTVKPGITASMYTGPSSQSKNNYGVGGEARIQLAQDKSDARGNPRIWGKVLDGTQAGKAAWFRIAELKCAE